MNRSWMMPVLIGLLAGNLLLGGCSGSDAEAEDTAQNITPAEKTTPAAKTPPAESAPKQTQAPTTAQAPVDEEIRAAEVRKGALPAVDTSALRDAPAWQLPDLEGNTLSSAQFAGKVIIFDFWATWCGPCKMEIPHFNELQAEYGDRLAVIGVDVGEPLAKVKAFVEASNVTYLTLLATREVADAYGPISGLPTTFVLTQDGKIYKRYVGYRPKQVFQRDIAALLGE